MSILLMQGTLYIVATPIGNLADISLRALDILKQVDIIAAEDTRHIKILLSHYGIHNRVLALHQHNEDKLSQQLVEQLQAGQSIALVSDAGTPLISDPGLPLVQAVRSAQVPIVAIPGACALIAGLSVSGLPLSRFLFEGFAPRTTGARQRFFQEHIDLPFTWAFYESSHRIVDCVHDMAQVFEGSRQIVVARELTKQYETVVACTLAEMLERFDNDAMMSKGEFVVMVAGAKEKDQTQLTAEQEKFLQALLKKTSLKTAVDIMTECTGLRKKLIYSIALETNERISTAE